MPLRDWLGPVLVSAGAGALIAAGIAASLSRQNDFEAERVAFLKGEVAKLDKDIAEVKSLRDEIMQLLARKAVAEALQQDRGLSVQLLEQLARQRPAGVQLTAIREQQGRVQITGRVRSEPAAAALVRNLTGSPLFSTVELGELRAERFSVNAALKGSRLAAGSPTGPSMPPDIHPGDPK